MRVIRWYRTTRRRHRVAFTLIEIMIVVAIIGLLAGLAVVRYENFVCKSQETEAKTVLRKIYDEESEAFGTGGAYIALETCTFGYFGTTCTGGPLDPYGNPIPGVATFSLSFKGRSRFSYSVDVDPSLKAFVAHAVGTTGAVLGGELTINQDGELGVTGSVCR